MGCYLELTARRIRHGIVVYVLCFLVAFQSSCGIGKTIVTGEIFLVTRGGEARKLAAVEVMFSMKGSGLLKTTTDSDGRFEITIPKGSYLLHASTTIDEPLPSSGRLYPKVYSWMFPFEATESRQSLTLNNSNLFQKQSDLLRVFEYLT